VLAAGTNLLAVRGLNTTLTSSDLLLDVEVYATAQDPALAPPTVASVTPTPGPVIELGSLTVRFSEPVTNVNAADLRINGIAATNVSGTRETWTFVFPSPPTAPSISPGPPAMGSPI